MNAARNVKLLYHCWLETRKRIDRGESLWHSTAKCAAVGTWSWQYSSLSLSLRPLFVAQRSTFHREWQGESSCVNRPTKYTASAPIWSVHFRLEGVIYRARHLDPTPSTVRRRPPAMTDNGLLWLCCPSFLIVTWWPHTHGNHSKQQQKTSTLLLLYVCIHCAGLKTTHE